MWLLTDEEIINLPIKHKRDDDVETLTNILLRAIAKAQAKKIFELIEFFEIEDFETDGEGYIAISKTNWQQFKEELQ